MPAAYTQAEVCNLALGLIGARQFIDNLNGPDAESRACKVYWSPTVKRLLSRFDWSFARRVSALPLVPEERTGWAFCYAPPPGMLVPRRIWSGKRRPGVGELVPFEVQLNDALTGVLICTDMEDAVLRYTVELDSVVLWSPAFVEAVAAALAVSLAGALAVKPELMPRLEQAAQLRLLEAASLDANAGQDDEAPEAEHIAVRD